MADEKKESQPVAQTPTPPGPGTARPATAAEPVGTAKAAPEEPQAGAVRPATANDIGGENVQKVAPTGEPQASNLSNNELRKRIKEMEEQVKKMEDDRSVGNARARATMRAQLAELKDREAREKGGLNDLTPMANLLAVDAAVHEAHPDDHLRWVNETIPGRAALMRAKGYTRVEGQIQGGDMVLWKVPRDKWAEGVAGKVAATERQIRKAGSSQNRDDTVQELQTFFDKNNIKVDANSLVLRGE